MSTIASLMSAEEFANRSQLLPPSELVRGVVVEMNQPGFRHGELCGNVAGFLIAFVKPRGIGRVIVNDSGVVTERDPDTVRGPDVAYYSFERVPKGTSPNGYADRPPEIAIEVRSPSDAWSDILVKVGEFLRAGVNVVCVVDPVTWSAHVYTADESPRRLSGDDLLEFPGILVGFSIKLSELFE